MSLVEYHRRVKTAQARHPEWRSGQTHFNVLCHMHPKMAEQIWADDAVDPFYRDANLAPFIDWLQLHWPPPTGA